MLQSFFNATCMVDASIVQASCMVEDVAFRSTSGHCPIVFQHVCRRVFWGICCAHPAGYRAWILTTGTVDIQPKHRLGLTRDMVENIYWVSKLGSSSHLFMCIASIMFDLHSAQTFGSDTSGIFITSATMETTALRV